MINGEEKDLTKKLEFICSGSSSFRFRRQEHLKGRKEIRDVFDKGKQFTCQGAKFFLLKNNLPFNRICFTFSRGFGNAVARNRARRLSREAFRLMKNRLDCGYDFILLVYPDHLQSKLSDRSESTNMDLAGRKKQLESLFYKAGLLK